MHFFSHQLIGSGALILDLFRRKQRQNRRRAAATFKCTVRDATRWNGCNKSMSSDDGWRAEEEVLIELKSILMFSIEDGLTTAVG